MKHNAILGNIGHFDNEIDMYSLDNFPEIKMITIKDQLDKYIFPDGKAILVLASGRLLNLGCANRPPFLCNEVALTSLFTFNKATHLPIRLWLKWKSGQT